MSKLLVVSDNEFINLLYVMNLEVYLNAKVSLAHSVVEATDLLKSEKFDIIISLATIDKAEAGSAILDFLKSHGKKNALIITGAPKDEVISDQQIHLAQKFSMQSLLKACAKILGITAKQMSELNVGAFYPVSIGPLASIDLAPCHIYPSASAKKYLVRQDDPIGSILSDLASTGVKHVYVSSGDRLVITNKISLALIDKITANLKSLDNAPVEKKVQALSDGYEFAATNLFSSDEIKQQMQEIASVAAKVMGEVARDSSSLRSLLAVMMSNKDGYVFTHSMITSYVAYHMIKNVTWGGEGQVEKINFVLFFHDIFLAPIYLKHPELKSEPSLLESPLLDEKEKDIVLNHAKLAAEVVVGYKRCPMGADVLIKQHHGMKKGKGFVKFYMEDLSPLSKILLIAEMFVEEFMKSADNKAVPFNAKVVIPKLISEFKSPTYTKIVQSLINVPL